jgi:hypothetical protein
MNNHYSYDIETLNKSKERIRIETSRAEIELIPDQEKGGRLRTATVTIKGPHEFENFILAKQELAKVLLRCTCEHPRIIEIHGFLPREWKNESGKMIDLAKTEGISSHAQKSYLRDFNTGDDWCLRINVNSESPAILCYYEAMRRNFPIDKYRELFKVVEYFSGVRENGDRKKDFDRIYEHLGRENGWHIDQSAMRWAKQAFHNEHLDEEGLARKLLDCRDECSHMRPDHGTRRGYGVRPNDHEKISRIANIIPVLDRIVRCSLEKHPETRELSS